MKKDLLVTSAALAVLIFAYLWVVHFSVMLQDRSEEQKKLSPVIHQALTPEENASLDTADRAIKVGEKSIVFTPVTVTDEVSNESKSDHLRFAMEFTGGLEMCSEDGTNNAPDGCVSTFFFSTPTADGTWVDEMSDQITDTEYLTGRNVIEMDTDQPDKVTALIMVSDAKGGIVGQIKIDINAGTITPEIGE